jgi:RimJ/RimL family protein N-acetyltransferase
MVRVLEDPGLYVHIGGQPPSEAELAERYERQVAGASPDGSAGWLNWVLRLRDGGELAGVVQATVTRREAVLRAELAWMVAPPRQGSGLATEAAVAVSEWLRSAGVAVLRAWIHPQNVASAAVARRIGLADTPLVEDGEIVWESPPPE